MTYSDSRGGKKGSGGQKIVPEKMVEGREQIWETEQRRKSAKVQATTGAGVRAKGIGLELNA